LDEEQLVEERLLQRLAIEAALRRFAMDRCDGRGHGVRLASAQPETDAPLRLAALFPAGRGSAPAASLASSRSAASQSSSSQPGAKPRRSALKYARSAISARVSAAARGNASIDRLAIVAPLLARIAPRGGAVERPRSKKHAAGRRRAPARAPSRLTAHQSCGGLDGMHPDRARVTLRRSNVVRGAVRYLRAVSPKDSLAAELERTWHRDIPLAAAMQLEVAERSDDELLVRAPLAPNVNVHGTAFAGSLYSICVLTGWGAVWIALRQHALPGRIVVASARIEYRKAVAGDIICCCRLPAAARREAAEQLAATRRATLPLECSIDASGARAVDFSADYVVHLPRK
jgi:thioesterase domain-containing protein